MIQGTMSNAGKSILAGGLCRVFRQDGYRTAPFKSQNMALNSFITEDGLEMGRAQVMQAEAAGIAPRVEMNPVLLKPTSDTGSQVIVNGKVRGVMPAKEYYAYKKQLIPEILHAYEILAGEHDIIVIEGAGSPAEINLKQDDIVNMGLAKMLKAPVLLVGDIDRGGVFAQLAGTLLLLEEEERKMVKGLVINKFRGDVDILKPGLRMLEERTGCPVRGVIPYMYLDIDDEDSLSERLQSRMQKGKIDIAAVRFPKISNFTDLNVLSCYEGVSVRYVDRPGQFGDPDLVILPGTKNTMADLKWLKESGLAGKIQQAASRDVPVIGICGGYQMLGKRLSDPQGMEAGDSVPVSMEGLGLLPVETIFTGQKKRTRAEGFVSASDGFWGGIGGCRLEGYEIHMGETISAGGASFTGIRTMQEEGARMEGCVQGSVCGTYLHGFFDSAEISGKLVELLMRRKGLQVEDLKVLDFKAYKEEQYDQLAKMIREHLDMDAVYRILEEGV